MGANHDLDALEALFEEETEAFEENSFSLKEENSHGCDCSDGVKEDLTSMEAEYQKLQKQMECLQEKIKSKKSNEQFTLSKKIAVTALSTESTLAAKTTVSEKRSFCHAFSSTAYINSDIESENDKNSIDPINSKTHREKSSTQCSGNFFPSQKKPRISNFANENNNLSKISDQAIIRSKKKIPKQPINYEIENFSRIRLKDRFIDAVEFKQRMDAKLFLKLNLLRPTLSISENKDWVTIGVVAKQLDPQTAKNGKKYSIWQLTDLEDCSKQVSLFLFGKIYEDLWQNVTVGTVIGLLNPSIMPPKREPNYRGKNFDNSPALTIDVSERLIKIGVSADLGWCTATRFRNKQPAGKCLAFINKQYGDVCVFHMQSKYKKISSKRGELQATSAPGVPAKYKQTLWNKVKGDQFFYAGQTFSAAPPILQHHQSRKESKMKLTDIMKKCSDTPGSQAAEVQRSKIIQAVSGIEGKQTLDGCSDKFAEMLTSGDAVAGSRQFLNHLQKKKRALEEKNQTSNLTVSDLLKQQKELNEKKKQSSLQSPDHQLTASVFLKEQMQTIKQSKKANKSVPSANDQSEQVDTSPDKSNTKSLINPRVHQVPSDPQNSAQRSNPASGSRSASPSEILLQMKRDCYMKKNSTKLSVPSLSVPSGGQLSTPQLGYGSTDQQVDLFGDWLSLKSKVPSSRGSSSSLTELRKNRAIEKLRNRCGIVEIKNPDPNRSMIGMVRKVGASEKMKKLVQGRVEDNRKDLSEQNKENYQHNFSVLSKSKMTTEEFDRILSASSSHSDHLDVEEMERQENYFNPLIKKEMMEMKMQQTYELPAKVVTCQQCHYTFWAPHGRCQKLNHALLWRSVVKKFFECSQCKQRTTTWQPYPLRACRNCGSEKKWKKTSMMKEKEVKSEILLVRGEEHSKFLNSMKNGTW